eukprot:5495388-Alexandrium_andersonii.AAC.1
MGIGEVEELAWCDHRLLLLLRLRLRLGLELVRQRTLAREPERLDGLGDVAVHLRRLALGLGHVRILAVLVGSGAALGVLLEDAREGWWRDRSLAAA